MFESQLVTTDCLLCWFKKENLFYVYDLGTIYPVTTNRETNAYCCMLSTVIQPLLLLENEGATIAMMAPKILQRNLQQEDLTFATDPRNHQKHQMSRWSVLLLSQVSVSTMSISKSIYLLGWKPPPFPPKYRKLLL